jgi:prepilin-type processing-associated H-X9-DG protein
MNAYVGTGSSGWNTSYRQYVKSIDIVSPTPANLFVIIDEHEGSINDGAFFTNPTTSPSSDQIVDFPAARHDRGCTISFADGRVEIHQWRDARTMPPVGTSFTLVVASPNNVDVDWLNQRSSSRP